MSKYVYINGMRVVMEGIELESYSVLQHCELIGIQLPRFCYHDQLSIAGNCRMCMVELSTSAKPVIACSTEITAGMQIYTDSAMIRYARENVLEFLLINHPLDCPICDQGGECDLQDFSLMHGSDRGRFSEDKRTVLDTSFGALIKGIMTRCIHCTRCVRYFAEIVGSASVGTVGRGSDTEIMYMADMPYTNIAGNVIDICPVGALTSRPYSFACRPWELLSVESIDILDGLCSNITIDCRGAEIMRILPRANSILNIDWITDKIRFCYDGLKVQRIVSPMRRDLAGVLHICSWELAFRIFKVNFMRFAGAVESKSVYCFAGHLIDSFTLFMVRTLCNKFGLSNVNIHSTINVDFRTNYLISSDLATVFNDSNVLLLFAVNLMYDSPILNVRLRNNSFQNQAALRVGYIGSSSAFNYPVFHLGLCSSSLHTLFYGKSFFCHHIDHSIDGLICLFGSHSGWCDRRFLSALQCSANPAHYISLYSGDISMYELCVLQSFSVRSVFHKHCIARAFTYMIGSDFLDIRPGNFIVYQGHHLESAHDAADLVLPVSAFTEQSSLYVNCVGMLQRAAQAIAAPGDAWSNSLLTYSILCHVSDHAQLPDFDDYVCAYGAANPYPINTISSFLVCTYLTHLHDIARNMFIPCRMFVVSGPAYWSTDIISRSSINLSSVRNTRILA